MFIDKTWHLQGRSIDVKLLLNFKGIRGVLSILGWCLPHWSKWTFAMIIVGSKWTLAGYLALNYVPYVSYLTLYYR